MYCRVSKEKVFLDFDIHLYTYFLSFILNVLLVLKWMVLWIVFHFQIGFEFNTEIISCLKVVLATLLLVYFLCRKDSTSETSKNVFYFTSKVFFIPEIIRF